MRHAPFLLFVVAALIGSAAQARQEDDQPPAPEGVEVLTRGPIHEAFAEPIAFEPGPGPVVPKAPPEPLEELPPDQKPEGDNVTWIGGYWAWDDERSDFLWVSGVWRDIPPGRQWVPGYWEEAEGGHRWVPGHWISAELEEVTYLPQPPESMDEGPNTPPPTEQHAWAPGNWSWVDGRYAWSPGYWFEPRPDWVWIPAHYVWTPAGYMFVDGYWDYLMAQRGLLFAPAYVPPPLAAQPQFAYVPDVVIRDAMLADHLWVGPGSNGYYFGDYYAPAYQRAGFSYWATPDRGRLAYDPIFVQRNFARRQRDPGWLANVRRLYQTRLQDESARPPRIFTARRQPGARRPEASDALLLAAPLAALATGGADLPAGADRAEARRLRLERIDEQRRNELVGRAAALREFQRERRQNEAQAAREARVRDPEVNAARLRDEPAPKQDAPGKAVADRGKGAEKAQRRDAARALRLSRSPIAAQGGRQGEAGRAAAVPPPVPAPDARRPAAGAREQDRPGRGRPRPPDAGGADSPKGKGARPERPGAGRPDAPKSDRPEPPKADRPRAGGPDDGAPQRGVTRTERLRPPLPPPSEPEAKRRPDGRPPRGAGRPDAPGNRPDPGAAPAPPRPPEPPRAQPKAKPDRPADNPPPAARPEPGKEQAKGKPARPEPGEEQAKGKAARPEPGKEQAKGKGERD